MADPTPAEDAKAIVIKKYANRRLYNTASSSYVTLDHLCQMVKQNKDFVVFDAKTGENITRSVLTQIIVEEESKGESLLPISFLRQLIGFYGDSLQALVPGYLDISMSTFSRNQDQMRKNLADAFGEMFPFKRLEELGRNNMAIFQKAMSLFNPFALPEAPEGRAGEGNPGEGKPGQKAAGEDLSALRAEIDNLQRRLNELGRKERKE